MGLNIHPPLKPKQITNPSSSLGNELVSHFFMEREHQKILCHSEYCEFSTEIIFLEIMLFQQNK